MGEVSVSDRDMVRIDGYSFVFDISKGFVRLPRRRERIVSLSDARNIVTVLPPSADLEATVYKLSKDKRLVLSDGTFELEITEFSPSR